MPLQQHLQEPDHTTADGKKSTALISVLGHRLEGKFQTYKSARYDKEREWERAIHQYTGKWDRDDREKIEIVWPALPRIEPGEKCRTPL